MDDLARRIRMASQLLGNFTLRSGRVSDTYFDKYRFEADPALLLAIANAMAPLIPSGCNTLAGLEMGGIPIVTLLSQVTGLPTTFLRKKPKSYGTCQYAEGTSLKGQSFLLIEDVVSTGGALIDTLSMLKADELWPIGALCVIDRESGGKQALAGAGLELKSLFTYSQIVDDSTMGSAE
jgi:orotate phosphoribosyltransferase